MRQLWQAQERRDSSPAGRRGFQEEAERSPKERVPVVRHVVVGEVPDKAGNRRDLNPSFQGEANERSRRPKFFLAYRGTSLRKRASWGKGSCR